eukprot:maker-scaffold575_size133042-snap-gene-0.31 protein:Tk10163 transcript:maker-scaffold575_size133042-snap-gene-0.31-mRNA-1 annotation:"octopamine receptor"
MNESIDSYVLIVDDDSDDDAIGPEPNNHQPGSSSLHDLNFTLFELSNQSTVSWIKNCSNAFENIDLEDPRVLGSLVPLGIICLVVIFGNIMVIAAVKMTHKLRGATNLFIVSLAWADLMLGMVVLPFSAMYEVFDIWIFGRIWCSIWLAMDVWVCTASILHLVVISLDRYIAVTHPITYPNIMTSNRAKLLIVGAWVLSFVICFPPLVGWNDESSPAMWVPAEFTVANLVAQGGTNSSSSFHLNNNPDVLAILSRCMPQCKLIQEPGYVIYSAVGSFYAPMLVMMFFNWRIYRTAKKTTKAIRQGWTKVKVGGANAVGMGIHRGGGGAMSMANLTTIQNNAKTSRRSSMARPSNALNPSSRRPSASGIVLSSSTILSSGAGKPNHPAQARSTDDLHHSRLSAHASNHGSVNNLTQNLIQQHTCGGSANKFGKRNIKNQVRRFRMETKAAKTLGIIVGCFICCWFPFFTMYLITAFCEDCFPELAFSIIFWMGYCNSAINPFIYAMFSREFRGAFKKILCKFLCNKNEPRGGALVRMGLPFAPQTVAIGLTDRFSPAVLTVGGGHLQNGHNGLNDNPSSSNSDSMKTKKIT